MSKNYEDYLKEHILNVTKGYIWLKENNIIRKDNKIDDIIAKHDKSKYVKVEYDAYDSYFYGTKTDTTIKNFDYAWLHHIHKNPHHWEYWLLLEDNGLKALEMPKEYVIEMVCDWWSFSWKIGKLDEIFNWYEEHKHKMMLHPKTRRYVEYLLDEIRDTLGCIKK